MSDLELSLCIRRTMTLIIILIGKFLNYFNGTGTLFAQNQKINDIFFVKVKNQRFLIAKIRISALLSTSKNHMYKLKVLCFVKIEKTKTLSLLNQTFFCQNPKTKFFDL